MVKKIPISKLVKNEGQIEGLPSNPRIKDENLYNKLKQSIIDDPEMLDFRELLVYPYNNLYVVVGGNMRLEACIELEYEEIPCKIIPKNISVEKLKAIAIKDNISYGIWDTEKIKNEWDAVQIVDWGLNIDTFDNVNLDDFFGKGNAGKDDDDYHIPEKIETDIKYGDLFEISHDGLTHRLLCGDATKKDDLKILLNNNAPDMIFTDPPFDNESIEIYENIKRLSKNTNILIFASDKQIPYIFSCGIGQFKRLYVLNTNIASPTNNDVYVNHIALLRFKVGNACKFNDIHNGGRSIVEMEYRKNLHEEKSQKILQLFIQYWSNANQIVADFFGGSGSTLMAAHKLNRICYINEIEPTNCQIIIDRYKKSYAECSVKKIQK